MKNKKVYYVLAFCAMLIIGFTDGLRGPLIPGIRSTFSIDYSSIGVMFFTAGLGFLMSTFFGGLLCERLGRKKVLMFGFVCVLLGITGISYSMSFAFFVFMMGFLNIGLGAVEIGINSLVAVIFVKNQAILMNLLHFFYGAGASIGPWHSGKLLSISFTWQNIYMAALMPVAIVFIYLIVLKFPEKSQLGHQERVPLKSIVKDRKVLLFGAALGFYVSSELGITNWFVNYLAVVYKMDELRGAAYLSLFFITFTAGRLVGGFIAEKLGYLRSIIIFMGASLILFTGGTLLGERYVFMISLCGLSFSIVFPTMVSVVIKEFKKSTSSILGFVITMSSGINMLSNWMIGKLNDSFGVMMGFMTVIIFMVIVIILVWAIKNKISGEEAVVQS